jgi:hypothetical protein
VRALRAEGFACWMLGDYDENVAHAQLVKIEQDGSITAASDPRSEGRWARSPRTLMALDSRAHRSARTAGSASLSSCL